MGRSSSSLVVGIGDPSGYLAAFEPDYVAATELCLADGLDLEGGRLITLDDVLSSARDEHVGCGLGVTEVYLDLYEREYQFAKKHPRKIVVPNIGDRRLSLFAGACFGAFPTGRSFDYLSRAYRDVFDPQATAVDSTNLFEVLTPGVGTPLRMGSAGLRVRQRAWSSGPTLFFMDGTSTRDLIDFWNLRALGWRIVPVPKQWSDALVEPCSRFVEENNVLRWPASDVKQRTTLLRSRSSSEAEVKNFAQRLHVPGPDALSVQSWYPRLWDDWARDKDHVQRCDIVADESDVECAVQDGRISFRSLTPSFADRFSSGDKARWVNVIRVPGYWRASELASVFPLGLRSLDDMFRTLERESVSVSTEGVVLRCRHSDRTHHWTWPDGVAVFQHWLAGHDLASDLSGAGRVALQVVHCLGGPSGARLIADVRIVKLLDRMAHGLIEAPADKESDGGGKPRTQGRLAVRGRWLELLRQTNYGSANAAKRHFSALIERGVLRVGLELPCSICGHANWFSPAAIRDAVTCERCLREFPFPASEPPLGAWKYRTQGPFSAENYAQGGYAVALALRFLGQGLRADTTWVPSLKITDDTGSEMEIDFGAWWRRESAFDSGEPTLLLGECKSFGQFKAKDVSRAKRLTARFPGATLVFATLRDELDTGETEGLATLARAGRKHFKDDLWRAPVLVLTSHELMSDIGPPYCWQDAGGRFAQFAKNFRGRGDLTELCDATQQLHLGMEPYHQWLEEEVKRLQQRRLRSQARRTTSRSRRKKSDAV